MRRSAFALLLAAIFAPGLAGAQGQEPPPAPAGPPPGGPPPQYYTEPAGPPGQGAPPPGAYEPPPPGGYYYGPAPVWEPPPPPKPRHRAPKTAFWLGGRVGYFVPFLNLLARRVSAQSYDEVKWSEYASSGPLFELDIGARFSRHYNVFFTWEHASLGTGDADAASNAWAISSEQTSASTDYYAIGLRFSSNADKVGFLTEINLGWRRFNAEWDDGTQLRMYEAPLEFRIGLGADIRVTTFFSLSPMVTLGAGAFGGGELERQNGQKSDPFLPGDEAAGHGWATFHLGGHFDIPPGEG